MQLHDIANVMEPTKIIPAAPTMHPHQRQFWQPIMLAPLLSVCLAVLPYVAEAQIFVCKDASGRTLTSDRPIPECATRPMRELSREGLQKREIAPPLTLEQRREKQEAEAKHAADEAASLERRQRAMGLLATYSDEKQIDAERQRAVSQMRNNINIGTTNIDAAVRRRNAAQAAADDLKAKGKRVPPDMIAKIAATDRSIAEEEKNVASLEAAMPSLKAKYDDILLRYREASGVDPTKPAAASASASAATVAASKKK